LQKEHITKPLKIMFLCTGNSCRSQMAEGFARHYGKGLIEAYSAGTKPSFVNPRAIAVMAEVGIDISSQHSKGIDIALLNQMDVVITLCGDAKETCPMTPPHVNRMHWPVFDPAKLEGSEEEILAGFRMARDIIKELVLRFIEETRQRS